MVAFWRRLLEQGSTYVFLVKSFLSYTGNRQINHRICFGRFLKEAKTRIIFGCVETIQNDKDAMLKETKVNLTTANKRMNEADENLYKNF